MDEQVSSQLCTDEKKKVTRAGSIKKCLQNICRKDNAAVESESYSELTDGNDRMEVCEFGVKKFTAVWWKAFLIIGILLLLVGVTCVATTFFFTEKDDSESTKWNVEKSILEGEIVVVEGKEKMDSKLQQRQRSQNMEVVKLLGLILFCVGGLTVAVALMIPSFLYRHFEVECTEDKNFLGPNEASSLINAANKPPTTSSSSSIPATQSLVEVQPSPSQTSSSQGRPNKAFRSESSVRGQ